MIKSLLHSVLKKLDMPESEEVDLSLESIALLKEFGIYNEGADIQEAPEADGEVGE